MKKNKPFSVYLLLILMLFLASGGIYGGVMLIADPSGNSIGLDMNFLQHAPFKNYLLPGIILTLFNGVFPLVIFYSLAFHPTWKWPVSINIYKEQYWGWTFALYCGLILSIWINVQILMIGTLGGIQGFYGLLGTVIVIITLIPSCKQFYSVNS